MDVCQGAATCMVLLHHVVQAIAQAGSLGACNPLPFPVLTGMAMSWLMYGLLLRDYYLFVPNVSAFVVGLYYTMTCHVYADAKTRSSMMWTLCIMLVSALLAAMVAFIPLAGTDASTGLMGTLTTLFLCTFYLSTLTHLGKVVRERDASSINPTLTLATLVNCGLWTVYGVVVGNPFIYCSNGFGIACAAVQVACLLAFRGAPAPAAAHAEGSVLGTGSPGCPDKHAKYRALPAPVTGLGRDEEFKEASLL